MRPGLAFTPTNGLFQVQVYNTQTGERKTTDVRVDLNGLEYGHTICNVWPRSSMRSTASAASITADGKLQITSDSPQIDFRLCRRHQRHARGPGHQYVFLRRRLARYRRQPTVVRAIPSKLAIVQRRHWPKIRKNGEQLANLLTAPLDHARRLVAGRDLRQL